MDRNNGIRIVALMVLLDVVVGMFQISETTTRVRGGGDWAQGTIHVEPQCMRLAKHLVEEKYPDRPITQNVYLAIQASIEACNTHFEDPRNKTMYSH